MNKLTYISILLLGLIGCSCNNESKNQHEQEMLVKQKNEKIISELLKKYSIQYSLDTVKYNYSIEFEDLLNTEYQIISWFKIHDIYKEDSISFVKIETGLLPTYYLNMTVSETEQEKLLTLNKSSFIRANAVMIVQIKEINKIDLTFENSRNFIGKGQIIEVRTLK